MTIRELEIVREIVERDVFKVDKHTMEYLLKEDDSLRAISESLLNDDEDYDNEVNSKPCYERIVYRYLKSEDKIKGFNFYEKGGLYFNDGSIEYDDMFYIFDKKYRDFEGGVYNKPFEIEVEEYDDMIEKVWDRR